MIPNTELSVDLRCRGSAAESGRRLMVRRISTVVTLVVVAALSL